MTVIEALAEAARLGKACRPASQEETVFAYAPDGKGREVVFMFTRNSRGRKEVDIGLTCNRRLLEEPWILCDHPRSSTEKRLSIADLMADS